MSSKRGVDIVVIFLSAPQMVVCPTIVGHDTFTSRPTTFVLRDHEVWGHKRTPSLFAKSPHLDRGKYNVSTDEHVKWLHMCTF